MAKKHSLVIKNTCDEKCNTIRIPDINRLKFGDERVGGTRIYYDGIEFNLPLAGRHMAFNACTAIEAVRSLARLGINIDVENIVKGIEGSIMPARMELIKKKPVLI